MSLLLLFVIFRQWQFWTDYLRIILQYCQMSKKRQPTVIILLLECLYFKNCFFNCIAYFTFFIFQITCRLRAFIKQSLAYNSAHVRTVTMQQLVWLKNHRLSTNVTTAITSVTTSKIQGFEIQRMSGTGHGTSANPSARKLLV